MEEMGFLILQVLMRSKRPLNAEQIRRQLRDLEEFRFAETYIHFNLEWMLEYAESKGLISAHRNSRQTYWTLSREWIPEDPHDREPAASGGAGRGRGGNNGDGEDEDGEGGIAEILSHPVLFSLDEEDFDTLMSNIFEGGRS
ncbi:MAG TPA: hypothetical protein DIT18_17020 [Pseudomonas sp.]|nr:hypothetical protein [Pseudomonas sp.]